MGELIDINEILWYSAGNYAVREERERFLESFDRIRPILCDLKTVLDFVSGSPKHVLRVFCLDLLNPNGKGLL